MKLMIASGMVMTLFVGVLIGAWLASGETERRVRVDTLDIYDGKPMPCDRSQSFVWLTYPSEALCLDQ